MHLAVHVLGSLIKEARVSAYVYILPSNVSRLSLPYYYLCSSYIAIIYMHAHG